MGVMKDRPSGELIFRALEHCPECGAEESTVAMFSVEGEKQRVLWCSKCCMFWEGRTVSEAFVAFHTPHPHEATPPEAHAAG